MEIKLLEDILIIFALATGVIYLFRKIRLPAIVGFLITGILAGPHGLGLVQSVHEIEILAEIGVVLLLFTIGIEFSLKNLLQIRKTVFMGGTIQVFLSVLFTFLILVLVGRSFGEAVFMGFMVALSSTAVVLRVLQGRADISSRYGKASLGILIFQDLVIIPMILFVPILAGESENIMTSVFWLTVKGAGIIILTYAASKWFVPRFLHQVAMAGSQELFLVSVLVLGFAVAWLTASIGLSLALGAFIAGLTISESEYSHQAFGNIIPFRDLFTSFFFVSIGMLLDVNYFISTPVLIILVALGVLLVKTFISGLVAFLLGLPFKATVMVGLTLSQVGEFSFILASLGLPAGLLDNDLYQIFLAVAVLTIAVTPFIIAIAPGLAELIMKLPLPGWLLRGGRAPVGAKPGILGNHTVIIGCGLNGRNVARAARVAGIPYIMVDSDADRVRKESEKGEPVFFGDAALAPVLQAVNISEASVVVIAISVATSTFRITEQVRQLNPRAHIVVRTRYIGDVSDLYRIGANEVIPEEFETSIEIFTRVLTKYLIPRDEIEKLVADVRSDGYKMFRSLHIPAADLNALSLKIPDIEISGFRVNEGSVLCGKSIGELRLRKKFGVTVLAVSRDEATIANPDPAMAILGNDVLFLIGDHLAMACASSLFREENLPEC